METIRDFKNMPPENYDMVASLMDKDIREEVHRDFAPCSTRKFYVEYCKLHKEKFNEDFENFILHGNY